MTPIAFDPGAEVYVEAKPCETMEALLERHAHGYVFKLIDADGDERVLAYLRADLLDDAIAAARTREAAA